MSLSELHHPIFFEKNVHQALFELPDDFKTIIILRDIQELSYDDISKIVKLPLGTVKSRINRGRVKLQQLLKQNHLKLKYFQLQ